MAETPIPDALREAFRRALDRVPERGAINFEGKQNPAAVALGRMGGKARAEGMSAKKRKEIAKKAAKARWGH